MEHGKTSAAKILARAINCLNPQDGEPCNECEICKAALQGSLTDIVEMDAASNNSVEDIRSIREEVNFLPTLAKYRVYIIDEVHMLSVGAFNALLKTLEEPPEHVKFILATTEPQKLPATILSRCQRFDYKKISEADIKKRLEFVCKESNINITDEALKIISVLAEGAMRDALSILERCTQEGEDQITDDMVKDLVGIPKTEYINKILNSVVNSDVDLTLKNIEEVINEGKDLNNLLWEIIKYVKDILVYKSSGSLAIYNENELKQIDEISKKCEKENLLNMIYSLSELANNLKISTQKTIMLEVGIMKLCNIVKGDFINPIEQKNIEKNPVIMKKIEYNENSQESNAEVDKKIKQLESKINQLSNLVINNSSQNVDNSSENLPKKEKTTRNAINNGPTNIVKSAIPVGKKSESWDKIVKGLKEDGKIMLYTNLINTTATEINDMTFGIVFPNGITPFGRSILDNPESVNELNRLVSLEYGKSMQVRYIDSKQEPIIKTGADEFAQESGLPINIIEE